eukprot:Pgem_evm1s2648
MKNCQRWSEGYSIHLADKIKSKKSPKTENSFKKGKHSAVRLSKPDIDTITSDQFDNKNNNNNNNNNNDDNDDDNNDSTNADTNAITTTTTTNNDNDDDEDWSVFSDNGGMDFSDFDIGLDNDFSSSSSGSSDEDQEQQDLGRYGQFEVTS